MTAILIHREVLVERKIFGQVADEQLDVTVAIEIAGGGAVAHAFFGQPPLVADIFEIQIPVVAEG